MNPHLDQLQPYPFEKLARLKQGLSPAPGLSPISLSIGEPRHATPPRITETLLAHLHLLSSYPGTKGLALLRQAIADWLTKRFTLNPNVLDPERHILPVNGTREGLFAIAQTVVNPNSRPAPKVLMPNPFYQIYEGAALLAGAQPQYLACRDELGLLPDFDAVTESTWQDTQLLYLCSPGNPSGAVMDEALLQRLIALADAHDFVIISDECYSEIYQDEDRPPPGLLGAAKRMGREDFSRCLVFHSLSKRSNAPGLRSGFVAGDAELIQSFLRYRTYHGCAMPLQHQHASAAAWRDEDHVIENRRLYREKFDAVLEILQPVLDVERPDAGFYLWPQTPMSDTEFAARLFAEQAVEVLPGSFLGREVDGHNPGANRVRMALVAPLDQCVEAAERIRVFCR